MFDWLRNAAGVVLRSLPGIGQVVRSYDQVNNTRRQVNQRIQQSPQLQARVPKPVQRVIQQPIPRLNIADLQRALQVPQQPKRSLADNILRNAPFIGAPIKTMQDATANADAQVAKMRPQDQARYQTIKAKGLELTNVPRQLNNAAGRIVNSQALTPVRENKVVRPVASFVNQGIVQPFVNSAARISDNAVNKQNYSGGVKGLAELGTDAYNVVSPFWSGGSGAKVAQKGLRAVPEAFAKGGLSAGGINTLNQLQTKDLKDIDPLEVALSAVIGGGANAGLPLSAKSLSKLSGAIRAKLTKPAKDLTARIEVPNFAEKGRLQAQGYTNVKVARNATPVGQAQMGQFADNVNPRDKGRFTANELPSRISHVTKAENAAKILQSGALKQSKAPLKGVEGARGVSFAGAKDAKLFSWGGKDNVRFEYKTSDVKRLGKLKIGKQGTFPEGSLPADVPNKYIRAAYAGTPETAAKLKAAGVKNVYIDPELNLKGGKAVNNNYDGPMPKKDPLEALKAEARKYKSADEFVKAKTGKSYAMDHRPSGGDSLLGIANGESDLYRKSLSRQGTTWDESRKAIQSLKGASPDTKVTIYRSSPKGELNAGDWVTLSKGYAEQMAEAKVDGSKVQKFTVPLKDIQSGGKDITEFGYFPSNKLGDKQLTDLYNQATKGAKADPLEALKAEARKYKSADEFVSSQVSRPKTTDNVWQDILPSGTRPDSIKKIVKSGGNPLYHDTTADGVLGILDSGKIKASQAPFSSLAGQGKRVSTTRNFDNYSRYNKSPYRLVVDESKAGQRAIPDNREEFESIFRKEVPTKAVNSIAIDTTNPALLADIRSGKLKSVIESAKKKGITIEPFEGKILPNEGANAEVQTMTSRAFSEAFPEYKTRISQLTDLYNQATKPERYNELVPKSYLEPKLSTKQTDTKTRGFIKTIQESNKTEDPTKVMLGMQNTEYTRKSNETLVREANKIIDTDINVARAVAEENSDRGVAVTGELIKHYQKQGDYGAAADLAVSTAERLTRAGREIQAASLYNKLEPAGIVQYANREVKKGGKELSQEMRVQLQKMAEDIQKMPDGEEKTIAIRKMLDSIGKERGSSAIGKTINLWKAGLLTSPVTTAGNLTANSVEVVLKKGWDDPVAAGADALMSIFTGNRSKALTLRGTGSGAVEGGVNGVKYFKTGYDERNPLSKFDIKNIYFSDKPAGKAAEAYTQTIFRSLGAQDQPFFYLGLRNSLADQAVTAAKNEGLRGKARSEFIKKFVTEPSEQALETANKEARYGVFQNETVLGKAASGLKNSLPEGVGDFVVPFTQVPSSVAMRIIDRTPIGIAKEIVSQAKKGKFNQRELAQAIGRGSTGVVIIGAGSALAGTGSLTFSPPKDSTERRLWELEGKQPYSVKVGNKWLSLNYFGPIGTLLAAGGQYQQAIKDGKSPAEAYTVAASSALKALSDQSFLKGVSGVIGAVQDPQRSAERFMEQTAGSVIPNIIRTTARATDKTQREVNGIPDAIVNGIPGARQTLNPRRDAFGQEMAAPNQGLDTLLNPLRPSQVKNNNDYLTIELRRLQEADNGVIPNIDSVDFFGKDSKISKDQLNKVQSEVGPRIKDAWEQIIRDPRYGKLNDGDKKRALDKAKDDIIAAYKYEAAPQYGQKQPDKLTSDQKSVIKSGQAKLKLPGDKATNPKEEYEAALEKYQQDKADGNISEIGDIARTKSLKKLEVAAKYDQDTVDLYGLSGKQLDAYLRTKQNGGALWRKVVEYDQALYEAGTITKPKFRDSKGNLYVPGTRAKGKKAKLAKVQKARAPKRLSIKKIKGSKSPRVAKRSVPVLRAKRNTRRKVTFSA